jgi:hypothetical protein
VKGSVTSRRILTLELILIEALLSRMMGVIKRLKRILNEKIPQYRVGSNLKRRYGFARNFNGYFGSERISYNPFSIANVIVAVVAVAKTYLLFETNAVGKKWERLLMGDDVTME